MNRVIAHNSMVLCLLKLTFLRKQNLCFVEKLCLIQNIYLELKDCLQILVTLQCLGRKNACTELIITAWLLWFVYDEICSPLWQFCMTSVT